MTVHPCLGLRQRKRMIRLATLTPNMQTAKAAIERAPLQRTADGHFVDHAGGIHLYPVVAGLVRRDLARLEGDQAVMP